MEVALQKKIDNPNVVRLYEVFKDERAYYLIEEVVRGTDLLTEIS